MPKEVAETDVFTINNLDTLVPAAFNRWLDEYENHPENFEQEWATIRRHLKEKADGVEPTYGEKCVGMLNRYIGELAEEEKEASPLEVKGEDVTLRPG